MTDRKQDEFDTALDAALAKYAAVEPRAGLEDRILANLRANQEHVRNRSWWRWSVAGALAAVVFVALALAWRSFKPSPVAVENHSSEAQIGKYPPMKAAVDERNAVRVPATSQTVRVVARRQHPSATASTQPKLDQFPSPRPLGEQERLLQNYVAEHPQHAVLVARALSEVIRPDQLKQIPAFLADDQATDSPEWNSDTTEQ